MSAFNRYVNTCSRVDWEILGIEEFHAKIKKVCAFPGYYGKNMSALSDCLLHDLEIPDESGCALVLKSFDLFYMKDKEMAHDILERLSIGIS